MQQKPNTAHVKGTDIVAIRGMLKQKGGQCLQDCISRLSPEAQSRFAEAMPTLWIPNAPAAEIMEQAAKILYPNCPDDLERLGKSCAEQAFAGIYKVFLQVTSLTFLMRNVALIWGIYHSVGKAQLVSKDEKTGTVMVVNGAPEVSIKNLRLVSGYAMRALEMAGAKNVKCQFSAGDPQAWRWTFTWTV